MRARRHRDVHERLDGLAVGLAVNKTADAANPFRHVDELKVILLLHQLLQAAMDESDRGPGLDHFFVLDHQVQVDRFRQDRVLRSKGYYSPCHQLFASEV